MSQAKTEEGNGLCIHRYILQIHNSLVSIYSSSEPGRWLQLRMQFARQLRIVGWQKPAPSCLVSYGLCLRLCAWSLVPFECVLCHTAGALSCAMCLYSCALFLCRITCALSLVPCFLCLVPCALCLVPCALCLVPYALCIMHYALSLMTFAFCIAHKKFSISICWQVL